MMLSRIQYYIASNDWMIVYNGLEREWEEAAPTQIEGLMSEFRGTVENYEKPRG
jgi:hypothetical protein